MFPHFYGYDSGDSAFSKDLLKALLQYLLFEHQNVRNKRVVIYRQRILDCSSRNQLSDIEIETQDV